MIDVCSLILLFLVFFCLGREKSYEFSGLKISNLCDSIAMTGELILILLFVWNKKWK